MLSRKQVVFQRQRREIGSGKCLIKLVSSGIERGHSISTAQKAYFAEGVHEIESSLAGIIKVKLRMRSLTAIFGVISTGKSADSRQIVRLLITLPIPPPP